MGLVLVLMIFVYPLALPVVTLGTLFFVASSIKQGAKVAGARAVVALPALLVLLSPGIVSTGAGSFLLPWWLHLMVGHTDVKYYPIQYALACVLLLVLFCFVIAVYRAFATRASGPTRRR
jgi:hypothetical protein